ncbi:hypothetical protein [Pandoraea oxalativorans]|nr:hypothetical protein [Pandoraea oxalativorans]
MHMLPVSSITAQPSTVTPVGSDTPRTKVLFTLTGDPPVPITFGDLRDAKEAKCYHDVNPEPCVWDIFRPEPSEDRELARAVFFGLVHPDAPIDQSKLVACCAKLADKLPPEHRDKLVFLAMNHDTVTVSLTGVDAAPLTQQLTTSGELKRTTDTFRQLANPEYVNMEALWEAVNIRAFDPVFERANSWQKTMLAKLAAPSTFEALAEALRPPRPEKTPTQQARMHKPQPEKSRPEKSLPEKPQPSKPVTIELFGVPDKLEECKESDQISLSKAGIDGAELANELASFTRNLVLVWQDNGYLIARIKYLGPTDFIDVSFFISRDDIHCVRVVHTHRTLP